MARHWRAASILVATLALATACHSGAASSDAGGPATKAPGGVATTAGATATTGGGGADDAFCAVAKAKGAANLHGISDSSSTVDPTTLLANLDAIVAAAPPDIKPDFVRFDAIEHALLGPHPDPTVLAAADGPDTLASMQRVGDYLVQKCGIGG